MDREKDQIRTSGWADEPMDEQMDRQKDKQTDRQTNERMESDAQNKGILF